MRALCWSLFWCALLYVLSAFAVVLAEWGWGLWLLCFYCLVNVGVLWLFFTVSWVGLGYVVVVFPGRSCSLTLIYMQKKLTNIQIQSFVLIMTAGLDTSDIYATEVSYFMCLQRKIHDLCSRK